MQNENQPIPNPFSTDPAPSTFPSPAQKPKPAGWIIGIIAVLVLALGVVVGILIGTNLSKKSDADQDKTSSQTTDDQASSNPTASDDKKSPNQSASQDTWDNLYDEPTNLGDVEALKRELVAAYAQATGKPAADYTVELKRKIMEVNPPYQTIYANMYGETIYANMYGEDKYGFYALFYRADADAAWQLGIAGNGIPECSEFDTAEKRAAFAGYSCHDDTEMTELK